MNFEKVLLIGCGKMGGALLDHWRSGPERFTIVDPALGQAPEGVRLFERRDSIAGERFDTIIVAIKPQMIADILPDYADNLAPGGYLLSIAAGASIASISSACGGAPVVRVMPNLPAAIGRGASGLCAAGSASEEQVAHARAMMQRTGSVLTVSDEDALDRVTAVAGSGPGYTFEFARAYVEAAMAMGFDRDEARQLVLGTISGTIAMALERDDASLEQLRDDVTSKGGTTAAGLDALNGDGTLSRLIEATLKAAYARAVELR